MPNRPKDKSLIAQVERLKKAFSHSDFLPDLEKYFRGSWWWSIDTNIQDLLLPSIEPYTGQGTYSGSHYDLRELCDRYQLYWPEDGELILRYLQVRLNGLNPAAKPQFHLVPPPRYWRWWRIANVGMHYVKPHEYDLIKEATKENETNSGKKKRKLFISGATIDDIAHLVNNSDWDNGEHASERTIQKCIDLCWRYLESLCDLDEVAKCAELTTPGEKAWLGVAQYLGKENYLGRKTSSS